MKAHELLKKLHLHQEDVYVGIEDQEVRLLGVFSVGYITVDGERFRVAIWKEAE